MADTIETQMQILSIKPGDVLVIQMRDRLSDSEADRAREVIDAAFSLSPFRPKVLFITNDVRFSLLRPEAGTYPATLQVVNPDRDIQNQRA